MSTLSAIEAGADVGKRRVLVVDDDAVTLEVLRTILDLEEYAVVTAVDGAEALARVVADHPDAVVLDVMMPGTDGFEVCRRIKEDPATKAIPVILLTARDLDVDRNRGLDAGCDAYLTKPFSPLVLIERLESLVGGKE